jgi:exopolyphosphatase/guanosine-5'-triphosphate,3'-diphosphate pyrophosphatase
VSWRTTRATASTELAAKRVAVIDLGSNSWRLVLYSYEPGDWWKLTDELYETVRIGAGMGEDNRLQDEAMARGLETLAVFARFCKASHVSGHDVHTVATSAIRDAANQQEFLARAAQAAPELTIEVLSGEDEARLGYLAAVNSTTLREGTVLEIGGGSLQLIEVNRRRPGDMRSFELGAVRLTERFLADSGPAGKADLRRLRKFVTKQLSELSWLKGRGQRLVGIGGAVRNLASAAALQAGQPDIGVQGFLLTREILGDLVSELAGLSQAERGRLPGIKPGRGDIVLAAAATIEAVVDFADVEGIETTEAGLREGVFFERVLLAGHEPLFEDVREAAVRNLAIQYESDLVHVEHVARLSLQLFDSLADQKVFTPVEGERELLWAAAMLHDVGMTISYDDHHKHSRYLILTGGLPGFDPRERALIAQITRYHRKGEPKLGFLAPMMRDGDLEVLERGASLLRVAEHLERGRDQAVNEVRVRRNGDAAALHLRASGDITLPRWSVERYGDADLFERAFGSRLDLD